MKRVKGSGEGKGGRGKDSREKREGKSEEVCDINFGYLRLKHRVGEREKEQKTRARMGEGRINQ